MDESADLGFFDALVLGSILLAAVFGTLYVAFFLVPVFWIVLLCGWPVILLIVCVYSYLRRFSRSDVMTGGTPLFATPPMAKFCPACGTAWDVNSTDCLACGRKLLPRYDVWTPPALFCLECGSALEAVSRYRRGWCPGCRVYR